tara:strand:+ start:261 stop:782 length:522 start_codon:yes stop_codon:yes gene_type:complete
MTEAQSTVAQFAGRTTLSSGSATVTVSTNVVNSDSIITAFTEGNANVNILYGTVTVNSGSQFASVSNAAIAADSLVFLTMAAGGTDQNSGTSSSVEVKSLGAGSMDVGWGAADNPRAANTTVNYQVLPADGQPAPVEVKSISSANFFTLGRADGRAAARDTIITWTLTITSDV